MHGHMRHVFVVNPLVRAQLRAVNLETLAREAPPPGHWARAAARSGVLEAAAAASEARAELREMFPLRQAAMVRG